MKIKICERKRCLVDYTNPTYTPYCSYLCMVAAIHIDPDPKAFWGDTCLYNGVITTDRKLREAGIAIND